MINADEVYQMIVHYNLRREFGVVDRAGEWQKISFWRWREAWRLTGLQRLHELEGVTPLQARPLTDI